MANYALLFKPSVEKDLRRLPTAMVNRILERVEHLTTDPFPAQSLKLAGGQQMYRLRVGDYRIIYSVDEAAAQIMVHYIRHRRDVYRTI